MIPVKDGILKNVSAYSGETNSSPSNLGKKRKVSFADDVSSLSKRKIDELSKATIMLEYYPVKRKFENLVREAEENEFINDFWLKQHVQEVSQATMSCWNSTNLLLARNIEYVKNLRGKKERVKVENCSCDRSGLLTSKKLAQKYKEEADALTSLSTTYAVCVKEMREECEKNLFTQLDHVLKLRKAKTEVLEKELAMLADIRACLLEK